MQSEKKQFSNWTEYDDWLVQNYAENAIFRADEVDGHIEIEFCPKKDFQTEMAKADAEKEAAQAAQK